MIESIRHQEKVSAPLVRSIYGMISRCFTVLFNIRRFSNLLVLNQSEDKNDFIVCSIVIKNFASYFQSVREQLGKNHREISELKSSKQRKQQELDKIRIEYEQIRKSIEELVQKLNETRGDNVIQNDVVYHLATKSESLEELDAELEAENVIGVLKNTRVSTELSLTYPIAGKIVAEFGDKGENNEMVRYTAFESSFPNALITAPVDGVVVFAGEFLNYGNMVIISNGEYRVFLYGMRVLYVAPGDLLESGDLVGKMHGSIDENRMIRMELKRSGESLDPRSWMQETWEGKK
jgi:septal ring factor EnvC (AmiA/AmiB activator)